MSWTTLILDNDKRAEFEETLRANCDLLTYGDKANIAATVAASIRRNLEDLPNEAKANILMRVGLGISEAVDRAIVAAETKFVERLIAKLEGAAG